MLQSETQAFLAALEITLVPLNVKLCVNVNQFYKLFEEAVD